MRMADILIFPGEYTPALELGLLFVIKNLRTALRVGRPVFNILFFVMEMAWIPGDSLFLNFIVRMYVKKAAPTISPVSFTDAAIPARKPANPNMQQADLEHARFLKRSSIPAT